MNKMFGMIAGLLIVVPVVAMELVITEKENSDFVSHLSRAVMFSNKVVVEKQVTEKNPIHVMLNKLSDDLAKTDNNLLKMIEVQNLNTRINEYKKLDAFFSPLCEFAKEQIKAGEGDVNAAKYLIVRNRRTLAELKLAKKQPSYSKAWIGEVETNARINFMLRNEGYSSDEEAIKDYIAAFIYSMVLAPRVD